MAPPLTLLDLEFAPRSAVVRTARDATCVVAPALSRERRDDVRLLVSEIVTNSVLHGNRSASERWIRLRVESGDGRVRVEVRNPGSAVSFERKSQSGAIRESGWGLYLLENLADRWGVSTEEGETCVWFEVNQEG